MNTNTNTQTIADLASIALGNDGQDYAFFGILDHDLSCAVEGGRLYQFDDGSAILDCGGGGWDVAVTCKECDTWTWSGEGTCSGCGADL